MLKIKSFITSLAVLLTTTSALLGFTVTLTSTPAMASACTPNSQFLGFPNWYRGLNCENGVVTMTRGSANLGSVVTTIVLNIVDMAVRASALVALGFVIWGGIRYMTSQGDSGRLASAKDTIFKAIIGLVIATMASIFIGFIVSRLGA